MNAIYLLQITGTEQELKAFHNFLPSQTSATPKVLFHQTFTPKEPQPDQPQIHVLYSTNLELPLYLCDTHGNIIREFAAAEVTALQANAIANHIHYSHSPNAGYNHSHHPLLNTNHSEIWQATCAEFGFTPSTELTLHAEDTEDESESTARITLSIPQSLADQFLSTTETITAILKKHLPEILPTPNQPLWTHAADYETQTHRAMLETHELFHSAYSKPTTNPFSLRQLRAIVEIRNHLESLSI